MVRDILTTVFDAIRIIAIVSLKMTRLGVTVHTVTLLDHYACECHKMVRDILAINDCTGSTQEGTLRSSAHRLIGSSAHRLIGSLADIAFSTYSKYTSSIPIKPAKR